MLRERSRKLILLIIFFFNIVGFSQTIRLTPNDNLREKIQSSLPGDTFFLEKGEYIIFETIDIPSGVTILGTDNQTLLKQGIDSNEAFAFFQIENSRDIVVRNLHIMLQKNSRGIVTTMKNIQSDHIKIENITFDGNLDILEMAGAESSTAISFNYVKNVWIVGCHIARTMGEIYVLDGEDIYIENNDLVQVNLASINVGGDHIHIIKNHVNESGRGTEWLPYHGDAVTVRERSYDVQIEGNVFKTGYCYIIFVGSGVNSLCIKNNVIRDGVTVGVYIDNVSNCEVIGNEFISNRSYGLGFSGDTYNTSISRNRFYNNGLYLRNANNTSIQDNDFLESSPQSSPLVVDDTPMMQNNEIQYSSLLANPFLVMGINGQFLSSEGQVSVVVESPEVHVSIENRGDKPIKFMGLPQVALSSAHNSIIPIILDGQVPRIRSYHQPIHLSLRPGETDELVITVPALSFLEFYIIIPTDMDPTPLWYKVDLMNIGSF